MIRRTLDFNRMTNKITLNISATNGYRYPQHLKKKSNYSINILDGKRYKTIMNSP